MLIFLLSGDCGDEWPLDEDQRLLIQTNFFYLINNMDAVDIVNRMFAKRCINEWHRDSILARATNYEKNEHCLSILLLRSIANFSCFIECLRETGQKHIASCLLQGTGIVSYSVLLV